MSAIADTQLLSAARNGDEDAYRRLVEPRRAELHAHCYRMLGSVHDAEDALQDALLRAWRGIGRFEGRSSLRSWLYRIATNTCLDVAGRNKRVLPIDFGPGADPHDSPGEPVVESVWVEPYPDAEVAYEQRESVELAFVAALQHLPATQRAVLILREVLGFSAQEVADTLDTTVASVNSALQRARKAVDERMPEQSQQATLRALGDEEVAEIVERYTAALEAGDVDRVVALLTEDATWSMPPCPMWFRGIETVSAFLTDYPLNERWRHIPTRANGQLAVGCYMWDGERFAAAVLDVLTLRGDKVADVTAFLAPWVFSRFGEADGFMTDEMFARFGLPAAV
jgi:RNA polymerase sigma-70 factor (ECF subfamily)